MKLLGPLVLWALTAVGVTIVVWHHVGYFRRRRPFSFGAFLETTGWIIVTLVAIFGLGGGFADPGTRVVEIAAAIVGVIFIGIGSFFYG